uniref:UBN2 domain-containing protein n=1 Tax=Chenopodium quinoa TaxID=63459 RepID=A0A803MAM1_CHEQI
MKTMFKSQELWDLVENGYDEPNPAPAIPDAQLKENRKKDAKALFFIQSALDDDIFPRITAATSAHEAWETLKQEYLGDQRVIKVRLQTLRSDFAKLAMGEKEHVQNYLSRVIEIVSQMRSYGEKISNETIVSKVLRSLNDDWNNVVPAIEESKDLSSFTFDELMGSLLAHESRMKKSATKVEEKAFQVKGESSFKGKSENSGNHGRGRGGFRGGRGRGRGGYHGNGRGTGHFNDSRQHKTQILCHYCKKQGHKEVDCWTKQKNEQPQANFSEKAEDESRLFMAHSHISSSNHDVWFLDSGCSNHMSGARSLFKELDE